MKVISKNKRHILNKKKCFNSNGESKALRSAIFVPPQTAFSDKMADDKLRKYSPISGGTVERKAS